MPHPGSAGGRWAFILVVAVISAGWALAPEGMTFRARVSDDYRLPRDRQAGGYPALQFTPRGTGKVVLHWRLGLLKYRYHNALGAIAMLG